MSRARRASDRSAAAAFCFLLSTLLACDPAGAPRQATGPRPAAVPAAVAEPERSTTAGEEPGFLGVLLARESVDVAAEAAGRLTAVAVRAGDVVARGALVASLDTAIVGEDLAAARTVLREAEIEEEKSRIALADAEGKLARRNSFPEAFPKEELISAENQRDAAKAAVEGARVRVEEQRVRVEQLTRMVARGEVHAPFAGTIGVRYLDAGAMVSAGTPIVRIVGAEDRIVRFAIPEGKRQSVALGQPVTVVVRGSRLELRGSVEKISPEVDTASGMVFAEAKIDRLGPVAAALRPGEVVRVVPQHGRSV